MAQTLHVASVSGIAGPGYARRDAILRRSAGLAQVEIDPSDLAPELRSALSASATAEVSPWGDVDSAWFERRWNMGELEAVQAQSQALADSLNEMELHGLVPTGVRIQASGAVGAHPLALSEPFMVIAAPKTSGRAIVTALLGARLQTVMTPEEMTPEDRQWMAEQVGLTAVRRAVGDDAFKDWLSDAMALLAADFERGTAVEERVRRIARTCLDQPPGEIERIALGLGRRMQSRLERAVRRGFFVPLSFDFEAWLDGTLNAERRPEGR